MKRIVGIFTITSAVLSSARSKWLVPLIVASILIPTAGVSLYAAQGSGGAPAVQRTPEAARKELAQLNLEYSPEAFVKAAGDGDWLAVQLFLDAGMEVNRTNALGITARWMAEKAGQNEVASKLKQVGGRQSFHAETICDAIGSGNRFRNGSVFQDSEEPFKQLVRAHKESINSLSSRWITPLCAAIDKRNPKAVDILLADGADPNLKVDFRVALAGRYPELKDEHASLALAELCVELVCLEYRDSSAECSQAKAIVGLLKSAGATGGWGAAAASPNPEVEQVLSDLQRGMYPKTYAGWVASAFYSELRALRTNSTPIEPFPGAKQRVNDAFFRGFSDGGRDTRAYQQLWFAAIQGLIAADDRFAHEVAVGNVIPPAEAKAYLKGREFLGDSILSFERVYSPMLAAGTGDPNLTTEYGMTVLMTAVLGQRTDLVKALLARGAKWDSISETGDTALNIAEHFGNEDILKLLQAAAAGAVHRNASTEQNQTDEDAHYSRGIALAREGKHEEAVKEYEAALRLAPEFAEAHNNLGNALVRLGRVDDAVGHLQQAVRIKPDYAAAWNGLGSALWNQGKTNEAVVHALKAVEISPEYWEARYNLGMMYARCGEPQKAREQFEAVLRLKPDSEIAKTALSNLQKSGPDTRP